MTQKTGKRFLCQEEKTEKNENQRREQKIDLLRDDDSF